ncbi:MAG TPA: amidohydrolase family protein, partial [Polymorphobacter sp.]|nr:amidohydrolase family protein [Polymorphobacter sp.]
MTRFAIVAALLGTTLPGSPLAAQTTPPAAPLTVIHAGRLLDQPGKAARGPSTVTVQGGRIVSVTDGFTLAPAGATVIKLETSFVLPGLIDSHVHLESDAGGTAGLVEGVTDSVATRSYRAEVNGRKTLMAGFTTVRNLGGSDGITLALRDAVAAGWVTGPRIIDAGNSISTTSGHMDATLGMAEQFWPVIQQDNLCDGADACRKAVRLQIRRGVDVIKIATTGGVNSVIGAGVGKQIYPDEVKALVDTAHLYGKKIAV